MAGEEAPCRPSWLGKGQLSYGGTPFPCQTQPLGTTELMPPALWFLTDAHTHLPWGPPPLLGELSEHRVPSAPSLCSGQ